MNEKAYRILEFDRVKEKIASFAGSSMGRQEMMSIEPLTVRQDIEEKLRETDEAVRVVLARGRLPVGGLRDIKKKVRYAEKGRTLTMGDLLDIASSLRAASEVKPYLADPELSGIPLLRQYEQLLTDEKVLYHKISSCILSEEEMADEASPALSSIRRSIRKQHENVRSRINSMLSSREYSDLLQDHVAAMRDGRLVIPVKQEHRSRVPGIVHDRSATGATLFIEPQAAVEINNEIRELEAREQEEINRILKQLSGMVASEVRHIINNQKYLVRLDVIFAKAEYSVRNACCAAELNEDGRMDIRRGRHPLIDPDRVIPLDITAGDGYRTLIITGPNTGGKTVALKTAGLLLLMSQSGMHIPADPGTTLPVMREIYAEIGDEQSIEQSLSTFSSHMKGIVEITEGAAEDTFILLDELGAGTDPAEGAALAISILDELSSAGALVFATTHYSELKKYAISTEGVENASMEFDVETLSPTYRLRIGLPGKSNAFEISRKLGLRESVIQHASEILGSESMRFEDLIASIEAEKRQTEAELQRAQQIREELEEKERESRRRIQRDEEKIRRTLEKARETASDTVAEAKRFSDEVTRELKELRKSSRAEDAPARQQQIRKRIRDKSGQYQRMDQEKPAAVNHHPAKKEDLRLGDKVRVVSMDQKGIVASLPDDKNDLMVQIGLMKLRVPLSDIAVIDRHGVQKRFEKTEYGKMYRRKSMTIQTEINVIGKSLDEAIMEVDKYLDDAYMSGLGQVTVIHGRGSGILRKGLRDMFRRHQHVASFESADYYSGGDGATVVTLR